MTMYYFVSHFACIKLLRGIDKHTYSIAGGFWAVILSRAAWKSGWAGRNPTHSIIAADRSVAITGNMAWAQLLTA